MVAAAVMARIAEAAILACHKTDMDTFCGNFCRQVWPEDASDAGTDASRPSLAMIDGHQAHGVEAFEGRRCSVAFFTIGSYAMAPRRDVALLQRLGVNYLKAKVSYPARCDKCGSRLGLSSQWQHAPSGKDRD